MISRAALTTSDLSCGPTLTFLDSHATDLKRLNVHVRPSHGRPVESLEGAGR